MRLLILLFLFPTACQVATLSLLESEYFTLPAGSTLTLHHELPVPANDWSVYFQNGKATDFGPVDEYEPYCELYLGSAKDKAWSLQPDVFTIIRVDRGVEEAGSLQIKLASLTTGQFLHDFVPVHYITTLYLHSEQQPEVQELRCSHLAEPRVGSFLSLQQIRSALGEHFSLWLVEKQ